MADLLSFKVVPDVSATFTETEDICSINANHIDMCKFSSKEDAGYQRTTYTLKTIFDDLHKVPETSAAKGKANAKAEIEACQ